MTIQKMIEYKIVIPARYASTRFPGKPLVEIAGKTMLQWTYEAACQSQARDIYIATDDERIFESAKQYTDQVVMTATSHQNGTERLSEVSEKLAFADDSIVVNVQGDEPLIKPSDIDLVAYTLQQSNEAGISTLYYPISDINELFDPNIVKVVFNEQQLALYFSRAPIPWNRNSFQHLLQSPEQQSDNLTGYYRHIGLYAYKAGLLAQLKQLTPAQNELLESLEQLRALHHGIKIAVAQCDEIPGIGVDIKEDLIQVERILLQRSSQF